MQLDYWDLVHWRTLLAVAERFIEGGCSLITSLAVTKCYVAAGCPALMGGLSPALYRAHLYRPAMQKHHKHWCQQNIGTRQDFWFSPNFSSQYLWSQASYQKLVQAKSNHHHCPISVPPTVGLWAVTMGKGCKRPYHIKVKRVRKQTNFTSALFPKSILSNFPFWSLFCLSLGYMWDLPSIIHSIDMIRTVAIEGYLQFERVIFV